MFTQDLGSTPPNLSRSNQPIDYIFWSPNPRIGCHAPTLKAIMRTQASHNAGQPKHKAPMGQSQKVTMRKKVRRNSGALLVVQVSVSTLSQIQAYQPLLKPDSLCCFIDHPYVVGDQEGSNENANKGSVISSIKELH